MAASGFSSASHSPRDFGTTLSLGLGVVVAGLCEPGATEPLKMQPRPVGAFARKLGGATATELSHRLRVEIEGGGKMARE